MYLIGPASTRIWTDSNRNVTIRQYGRLEYGSEDFAGWIVASARAERAKTKLARKRSLRTRLRYFLNSFRGFAAFDLRGPDDVRHG